MQLECSESVVWQQASQLCICHRRRPSTPLIHTALIHALPITPEYQRPPPSPSPRARAQCLWRDWK